MAARSCPHLAIVQYFPRPNRCVDSPCAARGCPISWLCVDQGRSWPAQSPGIHHTELSLEPGPSSPPWIRPPWSASQGRDHPPLLFCWLCRCGLRYNCRSTLNRPGGAMTSSRSDRPAPTSFAEFGRCWRYPRQHSAPPRLTPQWNAREVTGGISFLTVLQLVWFLNVDELGPAPATKIHEELGACRHSSTGFGE